MKDETVRTLEAIKKADPHRFLTYDELVSELERFYLAHQPTLRAQVQRILSEMAENRIGDR